MLDATRPFRATSEAQQRGRPRSGDEQSLAATDPRYGS
jgi:hypothetical protein